MATGYRRRDRDFEAKLADRSALRARQEAEQITEMVRQVRDELIPVLVMLRYMRDVRDAS